MESAPFGNVKFKDTSKLTVSALYFASANVTNVSFKVRISGYNLSTFGPLERHQLIKDLMNATAGIHKVCHSVQLPGIHTGWDTITLLVNHSIPIVQVFITSLASGSVIAGVSIVIDTDVVGNLARALVDDSALRYLRYGSTNVDCGELPTGSNLAALAQQIAGKLVLPQAICSQRLFFQLLYTVWVA